MPHNREQQKKAGEKGGATTRTRHGHEHFSSAGRKGGAATKAEHGDEHFRALGKRGGEVMASRPEDLSRAGKLGGQATLEKLGKEHLMKLSLASAQERAARKVLPRLLEALEPFRTYLEKTEGQFEKMGAPKAGARATEKDGAPLHPASCGVTFGACLALLEQLRLAKGDATVRAVGTLADFSSIEAKADQEPPGRDLTVELDPDALASRGE